MKSTQSPERLLSVKETAFALGCSVSTVWRRVADGTLAQPLKIGGMSRWTPSDVDAVISRAEEERAA